MVARAHRGILLAAALVVPHHVFVTGNIPSGITDPVALRRLITTVSPGDIKPHLPPFGTIDAGLKGIVDTHFECKKDSGNIVFNPDKVAVPVGAQPVLHRGAQDQCKLKDIVLQKSSADKATMYFNYGECAGASNTTKPVTKATVAVKLAKVTAKTDHVSDFVKKLCNATFAGEASKVKVKLVVTETLRGVGMCNGTVLSSIKTVTATNELICRQECMNQMMRYSSLCEDSTIGELACMNKKPDLCRGYSYNSKTQNCTTYHGANVTETTGSDGSGKDWKCWGTDLQKTNYGARDLSTTPAPAIGMQGPPATRSTVMTFISPDGSFPSFDWITLQDATGKDATIGVASSQWDGLLTLFQSEPSTKRMLRSLSATSSPGDAQILMDSPAYGGAPGVTAPPLPVPVTPAPTKAAAAAGKTTVTTAAPKVITKVVHNDCTFPEVSNALISGLAVPLAVWIVVKFVYDTRYKPKRIDEDPAIVWVLIGVSFIACVVVTIITTQVVKVIMTPICNSSEFDLRIVGISIFSSCVCGCAISLYFVGRKVGEVAKPKQKFMMVALNEDGSTETLKSHDMVKDHEHDTVTNTIASTKKY